MMKKKVFFLLVLIIYEPQFSKRSFGFRPRRGCLDALRVWKAWKKTKTKVANLIKCGISHDKAWSIGNARQSHWRMAKNYYVNTAISTQNLKKAGYLCLTDSYLEWNPK